MGKNKLIFTLIFVIFFLFDVATNFKTNFLVSLSFVISIFLLEDSPIYILYLLLIDAFFSSFIGVFALPITLGVIISNLIASHFKIPYFLQVLIVVALQFFVLISATNNPQYVFEFSFITYIFSFAFLIFVKKVFYEQEKIRV